MPGRRCLLAAVLLLVGCGGGSDPGEPLIIANVSGSADGTAFVAAYGVSAVLQSGTVSTVIGTGEVHCGHVTSSAPPPSGIYVNIQIPEAVTGVASQRFFNFTIVDRGDVNGGGSNAGTVEVTDVSDTTIAMTVSYADTIESTSYDVSGNFEAVRCP